MRKKIIAAITILLLGVLLVYALRSYVFGVIVALVLFILFNKYYLLFVDKGWKRGLAAGAVLVGLTLAVLVPLLLVSIVLQNQLGSFLEQWRRIAAPVTESLTPGNADVTELLSTAGRFISAIFLSGAGVVTNFLVNLFLMYFVLFYLFLGQDKLKRVLFEESPFSKYNTLRLMKETDAIARAVVVTNGAIGILQGILLGIGFWIIGVPAPAVWGVMAVFASFIPVVGSLLVWGPALLWALFSRNTGMVIGILIVGLVVSSCDNFVRPFLQRKIGSIHPLVTLFGVFAGVPLFGLIGVFIGPLMVSYFLLMFSMYREEFR